MKDFVNPYQDAIECLETERDNSPELWAALNIGASRLRKKGREMTDSTDRTLARVQRNLADNLKDVARDDTLIEIGTKAILNGGFTWGESARLTNFALRFGLEAIADHIAAEATQNSLHKNVDTAPNSE